MCFPGLAFVNGWEGRHRRFGRDYAWSGLESPGHWLGAAKVKLW